MGLLNLLGQLWSDFIRHNTALIFNVHLFISSTHKRIIRATTINYAELKCLLPTG